MRKLREIIPGLFLRAGAGVGSGARGRAGLPAFFGRVHEVRLLILIVLLILFLIVMALPGEAAGLDREPGHVMG